MNWKVPVGSLEITESDKRAVQKVLDSNQLSPGKKCHEFKAKFAKQHGAKHGLIVNSGTDALRIALAAMKEKYKWPDKTKIIVPSVTFVATMNVVLQNNLTPIIADSGLHGFNYERMDWLKAEYKDAKAAIPVHLCGKANNLDYLKKLKLKILEDSCECMGVSDIQGDIACYSTYVCHLISTGVGGLSITNDQELYNLMWSYANHGRSLDKNIDIKKRFVFERIGYSSRATEFEAALGMEQLKRLPKNIQRRRDIADQLIRGLEGKMWTELHIPHELEDCHAYMMFPIVVKEDSGIDKWDLCKYLEDHGIETRELLPLTNQPCYKSMKINEDDYPEAQRLNKYGFYIGCHPQMTDKDVRYVIETLTKFPINGK